VRINEAIKRNGFRGLEKRIGYRFRKKALLAEALTHPSYRYETEASESDYQRLEFLGDAVLGLLAADRLMQTYPQENEGELTCRKSSIASGRALAAAARTLDLGGCLRLGRGETASGGADRESNLEDALEALMGAIWLDGGLKAARRFFDRYIFDRLHSAAPRFENPKGLLQEFAQKNGWPVPVYRVIEENGPDHDRLYRVEVTVSTYGYAGEGTSRREAEKAAAEQAVRRLIPAETNG
jgi:ribonuclease III